MFKKKVSFSKNTKNYDGKHPFSEAVIFIYDLFIIHKDYYLINKFCNSSTLELLINVKKLFINFIYRYKIKYNLYKNNIYNFNVFIPLLSNGGSSRIIKVNFIYYNCNDIIKICNILNFHISNKYNL